MSTHTVWVDRRYQRVVKTFTSWSRAEPDRESSGLAALSLLPGQPFSPELLAAGSDAGGRPWVSMTLLDADTCPTPIPTHLVRHWARLLGRMAEAKSPFDHRVDDRAGLLSDLGRALDRVVVADKGLASTLQAVGRQLPSFEVPPHDCFGQADGNIANVLCRGDNLYLVDFEASGSSDFAYEVAEVVEHISTRPRDALDVETFIAAAREERDFDDGALHQARIALATYWLLALLPGGAASRRNPPAYLRSQHEHLRGLLQGLDA